MNDRSTERRADRVLARLEGFARKPEDAATPQEKLVRAAETGGFEAMVAKAQPAEPPKMVTPEEREAERARAGKAVRKPKSRRKAARTQEPKAPKPPPTPNEAYVDEHCRWTQRGPGDYRAPVPYGRCMTEYDVMTGELIGDGYQHDEEDDAW